MLPLSIYWSMCTITNLTYDFMFNTLEEMHTQRIVLIQVNLKQE